MTLYLVRHAMPAVDPGADPASWELGPDGRVAAQALAALLPPEALLVASNEPKAWQTLAPERERRVVRDQRLGEVRRNEKFDDDFRGRRRGYVNGEIVPGWEPQSAVARRFAAAVGDARRRASGRDLVIGTHGMALTVWLAQEIGLADPGLFWADLRFPDLLTLDHRARQVARQQ